MTIDNGKLTSNNGVLPFLDKLLDGVEVEWKELGEVTQPTKNIQWNKTDKSYRYIDLTSVSREDNRIIETTRIEANNAPHRARKLVLTNDVIFATTRPTQMRYCLIPEEFSGQVASTGYCVLRAKKTKVLPKWILHWVSSSPFRAYLEENQSGSAYPAISDAKVKGFTIPIPPLPIQKEIVRILDTFTELTARKKQYEYYRELLLTFPGADTST